MPVELDTAFGELQTHESVKGYAGQWVRRAGPFEVVDQSIKSAERGAGYLVVARIDPYTGKRKKSCVVHYECPESPRLLDDRLRAATR
jgi:hypothetical protein